MTSFHYLFAIALPLLLIRVDAEPTILTETVAGPFQPAPTSVQIILPETLDPTQRYRVLYILPVEPGTEDHYGSGIQEAARADVANKHNVICVAPTFTAMPWYADHPTDPALQQERHFVETVVPWVDAHYPVEKSAHGRLLLGFSKSGYGAVMLLLRHPEFFGKAVAWDAPVDKTRPDQFRMIDVFGTDEHFNNYAIPSLIRAHGSQLKDSPPRIFLMRKKNGDHPMEATRNALKSAGIPHVYEVTDDIPHRWDSGWLPRAAALVLAVDG